MKAAMLIVVNEGLSQLKWLWFRDSRRLHDMVAFDEASRGTWGSLKLLRTVFVRMPLATCGALVVIASLAVDPFTQQMLGYYDCSVSLKSQHATLPRTNMFLPTEALSEQLAADILPVVQPAMYAGLFSSGLLPSFNCPSGNCTFPGPYHTVGFCSQCEDISGTVSFVGVCNNKTVDLQGSMACKAANWETYNLTLPSGLSLSGDGDSENSANPFTMTTTEDQTIEMLIANPQALVYNVRPQNCSTSQLNSFWLCKGFQAFSCKIKPCVRSFATTHVAAGQLHEKETSNTGTQDWGYSYGPTFGSVYGLVDKTCISTDEHNSLVAAGYDVDSQGQWLPFNTTFDATTRVAADAPFPESLLAHGCLYLADQYVIDQLWDTFFSNFFSGTISQENNNLGGNLAPWNGPLSLMPFYNYGTTDFDRINNIFQNISAALTTYVRQTGQTNHSSPVAGLTEHYAICLKVRWGWFALDGALAGTTLIFFGLIIFGTRDMETWKSSPLALIFHGLFSSDSSRSDGSDSERESMRRKLNSLHAMEKQAKEMIVRLDWKAGSLGFSQSSRSKTDTIEQADSE